MVSCFFCPKSTIGGGSSHLLWCLPTAPPHKPDLCGQRSAEKQSGRREDRPQATAKATAETNSHGAQTG